MRKDSANSDEIPIFATSRPSLQCTVNNKKLKAQQKK